MSVKKRLNSKCGMQVHFSDNYEYYLSNSRYVNKTDNEVAHSLNHPQGFSSQAHLKPKRILELQRRQAEGGEQSAVNHQHPENALSDSQILMSQKLQKLSKSKTIQNYLSLLK